LHLIDQEDLGKVKTVLLVNVSPQDWILTIDSTHVEFKVVASGNVLDF